MFYELDFFVWDLNREWKFEESRPEIPVQWTCFLLLVALANNIVFGVPILKYKTQNIFENDRNLLSQIVQNKYPLTVPEILSDGSLKYRIAIISDLDTDSKSSTEKFTWISYFKKGHLTYNPISNNISINWDSTSPSDEQLKSHWSYKGRGSELSELVTYNGELMTVDDKTGLVYMIEGKKLIPWVLVVDGSGHQKKGLKMEWATVKDSKLYVGSQGKELVAEDDGTIITDMSDMWIKTIDKNGVIKHLDWTKNFIKVRAAFGIHFPGYIIHEACVWSDVHNKWFFLPRKASLEPFNRFTDERKATNVLLAATPDFNNITITRIGEIVPNHGYSSFKFMPGTNDNVIIAIKTLENDNRTATYITAFTLNGQILYPETKVSDFKFEGFEFI